MSPESERRAFGLDYNTRAVPGSSIAAVLAEVDRQACCEVQANDDKRYSGAVSDSTYLKGLKMQQ